MVFSFFSPPFFLSLACLHSENVNKGILVTFLGPTGRCQLLSADLALLELHGGRGLCSHWSHYLALSYTWMDIPPQQLKLQEVMRC